MTVVREHLENRSGRPGAGIGPEKLSETLLKGRYCFENFMQEPLCSAKGALAAPSGSTLVPALVNTGRYTFEYAFLGEATAVLYPTLATDGGYDWKFDETLDEGVEINFGGLIAGHPRVYVPTEEDFFARILLSVEDASGADIFFGLRKVGAYAATLSEYADVFGVRIFGDDSSTHGVFTVISSATDFASTATTVEPLADATTIEIEVRSIGGQGFAYVNGTQIAVANKSFVADQAMSPTVRFLHTSDVAGQLKTYAFECGLMKDRAEGTLFSLASATS